MTKNTTLNAIFQKNAADSSEIKALQEDQAVFAFKSMDLNKALKFDILPIDYMQSDTLYKNRFEGRVYDPVILKTEIMVLDAREGGHQWLKGDRFKYVRDLKLFKKYGRNTFEEFINLDTPYAKSTVYNWISVRERYTYEQSVAAGSKLALISNSLNISDEDDRKEIIKKISNTDISYRDAKTMVSAINQERGMTFDEIREDAFTNEDEIVMVPERKPEKRNTEPVFEYHPVQMSILRPEFKSGQVILQKEQLDIIKKSHRKHQLLLCLEDEIDLRAAQDVLNDLSFQIMFSQRVQKKKSEYMSEGGQIKDKLRTQKKIYK